MNMLKKQGQNFGKDILLLKFGFK